MLNIFVTVGTTEFDELIKAVDVSCGNQQDLLITAQISKSSSYDPLNIDYFEFSEEIESYIDKADVIITHAGAGSVYSMLEKRKRLIVVPNLSRIDLHQIELATYVEKNNFALTCNSFDDLLELINSVSNKKFNVYKKDSFFGIEIIQGLLK
jgi:beta-1,4-N-acetylglucosaminyltransferase